MRTEWEQGRREGAAVVASPTLTELAPSSSGRGDHEVGPTPARFLGGPEEAAESRADEGQAEGSLDGSVPEGELIFLVPGTGSRGSVGHGWNVKRLVELEGIEPSSDECGPNVLRPFPRFGLDAVLEPGHELLVTSVP